MVLLNIFVISTFLMTVSLSTIINQIDAALMKSFMVIKTLMIYEEAEIACASLGARLATIDDSSDDTVIDAYVAKTANLVGSYWIGGYDTGNGNWKWNDGKTIASGYTNWKDGSVPNDATSKCLTLFINAGWQGMDCLTTLPALCEFYQDKYEPFYNYMSWDNAKYQCYSIGMELATINEEGENMLVDKLLLGSKARFFIGGYEDTTEGNWKWLNSKQIPLPPSTSPSYSNWISNRPRTDATRNCLGFYTSSAEKGRWADYNCEDQLPYICSYRDPKYTYIRTASTWDEANKYCAERGWKLADIKSTDDQSAIDQLTGNPSTTYVWVGGRQYNKIWRWNDRNVISTSYNTISNAYSNWAIGAPDPILSDYCMAIDTNGYWRAGSCTNTFSFVCQERDQVKRTKSFAFNSSPRSFNEAKTSCASNGGSLATIRNNNELKVIGGMFNQYQALFYIGGQDITGNGEWKWIDESTLLPNSKASDSSFSAWSKGYPTGNNVNRCLLIDSSTSWRNANCSTSLPFVCQTLSSCPTGYSPGYLNPDICYQSVIGFYQDSPSSTPKLCPVGHYCDPSVQSLPLATSKQASGNSDLGASIAVPCNTDICYRYMVVKPLVSVDDFESAINSTDATKTYVVKGVKRGTRINKFTGKSVSNGKQIYVECEKSELHTPIVIDKTLVIDDTADGFMINKVIFKNCLVIGSIELKPNAMIILDNSSLATKPNILSTVETPAYIIMMDTSHIVDIGVSYNLNGRDRKVVLIKEGGSNAVYGCDVLPSCDHAGFLNNTATFPTSYQPYYTDIDMMWAYSDEFTSNSASVASENDAFRMVIQSTLTCGATESIYHPRSTYLGIGFYCGMMSDKVTDKAKFILNANELVKSITLAPSDSDYGLLSYVSDTISARLQLYQTKESDDNTFAVVPRVSIDFLRKGDCTFCINKLKDKLYDTNDKIGQIQNGIKSATETLVKSIQEANEWKDIVTKINENSAKLIGSQVALFKNLKANSQVSYNNAVYSLNIAKDQYNLAQAKFTTISDKVTEHQTTLSTLKIEMETAWKAAVIKDLAWKSAKFAVDTISLGLLGANTWHIIAGDFGAVSDFVQQTYTYAESRAAFFKAVEVAQQTPAFRSLSASFTDYQEAMSGSLKAISDYISGEALDLSKFSMPISQVDYMRDNLITYLKDDSGCDGTFSDLNNICQKLFDEISAIATLLKEKNGNIMKLVEATMNVKLLTYEVNQYEKSVNAWNDGVQAISDTTSQSNIVTNLVPKSGSKDQWMISTRKTMYSSLSRVLTHASLLVSNAVHAVRTICKASAYQYPQYLAGESLQWNSLCNDKPLGSDIDTIKARLEGLLTLTENAWLNSQSSKSVTLSYMDITSLLPKDYYKNHATPYKIYVTPDMYYRYSKDLAMGDDDNIDLVFVNLVVTSKDETILKPSGSGIYTHQVTLRAPYIRQYGGKEYQYDFEGSTPSIYQTQIKSTTTLDNIWSAGEAIIARDSAFAFDTPFASMEISIDSAFTTTDQNTKFLLQFHTISHGTRVTQSPTPSLDTSANANAIAAGIIVPVVAIAAFFIGRLIYKRKQRQTNSEKVNNDSAKMVSTTIAVKN